MTERRAIGDILRDFGRITEEDIERALEHQKHSGGYFGEALIALGIVKQEELEWGLASQFDLPYVFPDADSVDPDAAALVTPEWALAHLTLPIMRTSEAVTAVVDSPTKTEPIEELERRSGVEVRLALASGESIRELIRQVYARSTRSEDDPGARAPLGLGEFFSRSLHAGSARWGISVRARRAVGWYDEAGTVRRRLLTSSWSEDLGRMLDPPSSVEAEGRERAAWHARLDRDGVAGPVEVRYLSASGGKEYLFVSSDDRPTAEARFSRPSSELLSEIELLVQSGSARIAVSTAPPDLARELVPHLPSLVLSPFRRAVHLTEGESSNAVDVFSLVLPGGADERRDALVELRGFRFDAVTVAEDVFTGSWAEDILDLAGTVFVPRHADRNGKTLEKWGVRWELQVAKVEDGTELEWHLRPLSS